jgi:hypothetical protein
MTEPTPSPAPPTHTVGESYEFDEIRAALRGDPKPPNFVIRRGDAVVGVCLGLGWNPRAESEPCEVWVGYKGDLPKWGIKLAETKGPLPVYVRRTEGGKWFYNGLHEVTSHTADPAIIRTRLQPPKITAISRIVFMKKTGARA